jgi:alanine racemase
MNYTIEKITTLLGARRIGTADATIGWLLTDSRSLCFPEETLFFALKTARNDGHRYIDDLYRRGVRNFVVSTVPEAATVPVASAAGSIATTPAASPAGSYPDANFLVVPSPLAALQRLAERHRDEFDIPVVGITGSNGKTMVKEWLNQLLSPSMTVTRSPKSYNSQIGVPLSVWLLNEHTQVGLFEAGISQPDEMALLADIIQPTIGILTSLGAAHQENFRSMEEKCMEKLQLFHGTEAIVYPSDDDTVSRCIRRSGYRGQRIGWSMNDERAEMYIENRAECFENAEGSVNVQSGTPLGTTITYIYKGTRGQYTIPFIDEASIENSVTCAATAL